MAVPPLSTKAELRTRLKNDRQVIFFGMTSGERLAAYQQLAHHVLPRLAANEIVASYIPIGSEIGTSPIIDALAARGSPIALPHVTDRADSLRFLTWHPSHPLIDGPFGLLQPHADAAEVIPDVILTPLLGFDAALHRIGYGAGHYDRAFARLPDARRIGLSWAAQYCDVFVCDAWDVPLRAVATEREWIER